MADKIKVTIDGTVHEAEAGQNVLQLCLDRGVMVPHFCYHEALGPAGACRLCAAMVAPAADKPARLEMTCMLRATDGMVITVNAEYAEKFRKGVLEELMLNHPHDCPVCDEGGECMLQDMTVTTEHIHRRTRFPKRTWENQYLGPFIHHEMNRCITCYRCVRYYNDYAQGTDFGVFGSRSRVYFGRVNEGVLESEFAGNLVDVCPTGVFTNKAFREVYSRPWDLQTARSVCANCSVGCNVLPGFRHGLLRRIKPERNDEVNRFFMCDRGRFGGEFVNSGARIRFARVAGEEMDLAAGITRVAARLREIHEAHGPGSVAFIGSPRATLEANGALALLARAFGGPAAFFRSSSERDAIRRAAAVTTSGEVPIASLPEMEKADLIVIAGGDMTGEAPMFDLSLRQAIRAGAALYILSPREGRLDRFAKHALRVRPGEEPVVLDQVLSGSLLNKSELTAEKQAMVDELVTAFNAARHPLVVASAAHADSGVVDAAFWLAKRASRMDRKCLLAYAFPAVNSVGTGLVHGDENPEMLWADVHSGRIRALVVLERNAALDFDSVSAFESAASKLELLVAVDSFSHSTTQAAHAVLPCASHYQSFGTLLNYEGRAQKFDSLPVPSAANLSAGEVLLTLLQQTGAEDRIKGTEYHDIYDVTAGSSKALDALKTGEAGIRVRLASRLPVSKSPKRNLASAAKGGLVPWDIVSTFGSEELSALSASVAELAPAPVVELNPADAGSRGIEDGKVADFTRDFGVSAPAKLNPGLAPGTIGLPVILTNTAVVPEEVQA